MQPTLLLFWVVAPPESHGKPGKVKELQKSRTNHLEMKIRIDI